MEINGIQICNVCMRTSEESPNAVFMKAMKGGEEIHACTGCIPHIIHGSGDVVKSNAVIEAEYRK